MATLKELLRQATIRPDELATHLDGLAHAERVRQIRALCKQDQARLYALVAGAQAFGLEHFVPKGIPALTEVIHHGKNTLPAFTFFQKRFCWAPNQEVLFGYNEQTMRPLTGPGYFVGRPVEGENRVVIDYTLTPAHKAYGWPEIESNDKIPGSLVYGGMYDYMWKVSEHVSVGRATRNGKETDNYFVLCREDRP